MKFITILFLSFSLSSFAQKDSIPTSIDKTIFHFSPEERHILVNGVALGLSIHPWSYIDTCYVKVNGLNVELGPKGLVAGIYGTFFGIVGINNQAAYIPGLFSNKGYPDNNFHVKYGTYVNGLSVSIFGLTDTFNNGLILNGLAGYNHKTRGVQFSGLYNKTYEFTGVTVAAIGNTTNKAKGIQIGLINKCKTGQVLQIGLFNRIGKRVTPLINFRFKKDKKNT